ncbi:helix-turn-helix transcriptional regulator [Chryseobacterium wanjuense]
MMQLVKANDPFFLTRFKEVYPEFYQKLINHQPNLTEHDIKFCAYIRLNLNSKEIAQYDNIAIRSVESKKYRLKKKLELSTETDLTKWILEL